MCYFIFQLSAQLAASKEFADKVTLLPKEGVAAEGGAGDNKTVEELWEIIRLLLHFWNCSLVSISDLQSRNMELLLLLLLLL